MQGIYYYLLYTFVPAPTVARPCSIALLESQVIYYGVPYRNGLKWWWWLPEREETSWRDSLASGGQVRGWATRCVIEKETSKLNMILARCANAV